MRRSGPAFSDSVFINCPFDKQYWPIFEAIVFCIIDCGFTPRSALEDADSGTIRLNKILNIMKGSQYSLHDLSRVELGQDSFLPRFNMAFELGLDLGCRTFGQGTVKRKRCLILDADPHRYRVSLSDISGQDIQSHHNSPDTAITVVRKWLRITSKRKTLPGAKLIKARFTAFSQQLPKLCDQYGLDRLDLQFVEYVTFAEAWLKLESDS